MRLSVIGCGHLGAVHAACMANIGHEVLGVDIDEGKTEMLNSGKAWFHEPGLDVMLSRNVSGGQAPIHYELRRGREVRDRPLPLRSDSGAARREFMIFRSSRWPSLSWHSTSRGLL